MTARRRVRPLLLLLLWVWALCVFMTLDLFLDVAEFDSVRPRANLYRGMRVAAHAMVGEPLHDDGPLEAGPARAGPGPLPCDAALLAGCIHGTDGGPAAGARVVAREQETGVTVSGRTDDEGAFRLVVTPNCAYDVCAAGAAGVSAVTTDVFPPARLDLVLEDGAGIAGRTVDRYGAPVAGVVLRLARDDAMPESGDEFRLDLGDREATTGADGTFAFVHAPPSAALLRLEVVGGPVRVGEAIPAHAPSEGLLVPVERADPVAVSGFVRAYGDGTPLGGARVEFTCGETTVAGPDGSFAVRLPPGRVRVTVCAEGRPPHDEIVRVSLRTAALDVRVPAGRVIAGIVLDTRGRPLAGATARWTGRSWSGEPMRTDASGRFRLDGIPAAGDGAVRVDASGFVTIETLPRPGEEFVIRLEEGARLAGRVLGPGGEPAAGVLVRLMPGRRFGELASGVPEMHPRAGRGTRTDAKGGYVFEDLPAGATSVVAVPADPALAPAVVRVAVPRADAATAPDLRVVADAQVEGRVQDEHGRPVARALVQIVSVVGTRTTCTDADGRFAIGRCPGIGASAIVHHPGYWKHSVGLRGESVSVRLRARG